MIDPFDPGTADLSDRRDLARPRAIGAYIFAGGFTLGVLEHFDVACHLEGNNYGVPTVRLNFPNLPVHVGAENWPLDKLAKEPWDFIYGNPPCFSGDTKVFTEHGPVSIKQLVRNKSEERVWSVDASGRLVLNPIVGWHENPYCGEFYDVRLKHWTRGAWYVGSRARATANHKFMTRRGWIAAFDLKSDDEVCTGYFCPNEKQRELIDGMMLGDASIKKNQPQLVVSQTSPQYVELKRRALRQFVCQSGQDLARKMDDGGNRRPISWFYLKTDGWVKKEQSRWYGLHRARRLPEDVRLTPLSLAVWFMDDGARRARSDTETGQAMFCTDRLPETDVDALVIKLNELGIECCRIKKTNRVGGEVVGTYYRIVTSSVGAKKLIDVIAPYVCPEMRYKLPSWAPPYDERLWDLGEPDTEWDAITLSRTGRRSMRSHVYCIDVADTHNFATHGGIVHNCAAWSGNNVRSHTPGAWKKDPRVECTRNLFGLLEKLQPKVWAWESVTQAPVKGRELVDELISRAADLGYAATEVYHDAQWLGVPQVRKRWFLVLHRIAVTFPAPNWAPPTTVSEALSDVMPNGVAHDSNSNKGFLEAHLHEMPPGQRLFKFWESLVPEAERVTNARGQVVGRPTWGCVRLRPDRPSTATVGYAMVHPTEHRFMAVNEIQALAGFPRDYEFEGGAGRSGSAALDLIARGVCPPVGAWLARCVAAGLRGGDRPPERPVTVIDYREMPGSVVDRPPAVPARVPARVAPAVAPTALMTVPAATVATVPIAIAAGPVRDVRPKEGLGSGAYIRLLLSMGNYSPNQIVEMVHCHYPQSKATAKDVYWNRQKMRREGAAVPAPSGLSAIGADAIPPVVPDRAPTTMTEANGSAPPLAPPTIDELLAAIDRAGLQVSRRDSLLVLEKKIDDATPLITPTPVLADRPGLDPDCEFE